MRNITSFLLLIALLTTSCSSVKSIFDKKTPHEKYAEKLEDKHLDETPEGRQWLAASEKALEDAQTIDLPYRQHGNFRSNRPTALALGFKANMGERITFNLAKKGGGHFVIFVDLFKHNEKKSHLLSADTNRNEFSFDAGETGLYILRLQPKLFNSGSYTLSVSVGPSLGFPVSGNKTNIGGYWRDKRDGGKRLHEGIDIFAPKLTPAIAAADGVVTGVREEHLGGKIVVIRADDKNVALYYAHLDKQLVQEGQTVKEGDIIGLVGNTGNAKYTPSHLHFGVYTTKGPVNPLPFVNRNIKTAPAVAAKNLSGYLKLIKAQRTNEGLLIRADTELVPLAVNAAGYIAELPGGNIIQTPFASVKVMQQASEQVIPHLATAGANK